MSRRENERREDLAATSESLQRDAHRLVQIEDEKQDLDADDPRLDELSADAEELAGQVQQKSRVERALSEEGPTEPDDPDDRPRPD